MKQADILIKNAYLISMDDHRTVRDNACIAINGDKIEAVGGSELLELYQGRKTIDAAGRVVLPGFISTHSHLFQTMLKGLGRDKHLIDWLNSSVRVALHNYDEDTVYYAALNGCIEAIRSGTTTILDYMYCHPVKGLDEAVLRAFEDIGIRGILGRAFTNVGSFPPEIACPMVETEADFFEAVRRLEKQYRGHSRLSVCMAPGIIWDHTDDGFKEMRRTADELHIPITLHLQETEDDDAFSMEQYHERTIPHLDKLGVLGPDFIAVHCVNLTDEDIALFKERDVKVAHCPAANMILASGTARIVDLLKAGITVSLACDGSASSDTQNMLEIMKLSTFLQKVTTKDSAVVPASQVLEMATLGGAKALGRSDQLGCVEAGKKADLVFYNPASSYSGPIHDPVSALVYSSTPANIESVMVDGVMVLDKGSITTVDEERVLREAQRLGARLVERSGLGNVQWGQKMPAFHQA